MLHQIGLAVVLAGTMAYGSAIVEQAGGDTTATTAAATDGATADFARIFDQWTDVLRQLQAIRIEFQSASEQDKPALQARFAQLIDQARDLAPRLTMAAEKAYQEAPTSDPRIADLLLRLAFENLGTDNDEEALRLAKILIDGKTPDLRTYLVGGVAAFHVGQYDLAEAYYKVAGQAGLIDAGRAEANRVSPALVSQATQHLADLAGFRRLWAAEQQIRSAEARADDLPRVKLETSKGDIVLELFENQAPNTVANFVSLVEQGFYDGLSFHRVLTHFMAQGGCPRGDGSGGPDYQIACECNRNDFRRHFRGSLSMAHAGRDSGGSQFFLTFVRTPHLDGQHTVFGRIIEGMDVLSRLTRIDPNQAGPHPPPDKIIRATVLRKRPHAYQPKTLTAGS